MEDFINQKEYEHQQKWNKKQPKISGSIFKIGEPNLNGRIYSKECVEKMVEDFNEKIKKNEIIFGELDPDYNDSFSSLSNISHKVTEIHINSSDNTLDATLEILDTPKGILLKNILEKNLMESGAIGIASRGYGTMNSSTMEVEPENYKLITFDIVKTPAFKNTNIKITDL